MVNFIDTETVAKKTGLEDEGKLDESASVGSYGFTVPS